MDQDRWQQVEELFEQAMSAPSRERAELVRARRSTDPELAAEVERLLDGADGAAECLRGAVGEVLDDALRQLDGGAAALVGRHIGPFRLIELIGEGGMGAVYLAEREDGSFRHRVAIKVLARAMAQPLAIARFRDERRILAALEHPNIVRLLDGGNTAEHLPYLVMEYVEGKSITRYAREHELGVRACVELVRKVCAAMQYAHQNMVVHRDLKPANLLVDASGEPKILDFGIAKLLAPVPGLEREAETRTGAALFTPEYASPEQARGEAISTPTDVYALGAVLYELVAGQPPHRSSGDPLELLRAICEREPAPPSELAPPGKRRALAGDLDRIILQALHRNPARRYPSMAHFSDDLGRYLAGLPVSARVPTLAYRARKLLQRHKVPALALSAIALTLVLATGVSVWQARRADMARNHAIQAVEIAKQEATRARDAEARVQEQLARLQAAQKARAEAEAEAAARARDADSSRAQLERALQKAHADKLLAQDEAARAQKAEERARTAVHTAHSTRAECVRALSTGAEAAPVSQAAVTPKRRDPLRGIESW